MKFLMAICKKHSGFISLIFISYLLSSCTSNPFFSDEKIQTVKLKGQIELDDKTKPDGVYVWLESYDIGTFTDSDGKYSITLPSPEASGLGNDFSGDVSIYFYLANYGLDSSSAVIANGKLLEDQDNIDNDGNFIEKITLSKFVDIETFVEPEVVDFNKTNTFRVTIKLMALHETRDVKSLREIITPGGGFLRTGLIIESVEDSGENKIFIDLPESFLWGDMLFADQEQLLTIYVSNNQNIFSEGKYRVIPYLLPVQKGVPDGLIISLSPHVEEFCEDYLKLPIKRIEGSFEVLAAGK